MRNALNARIHLPAILASLALTWGSAAGSESSRPNILVALSDDHSYPHCSTYGVQWLSTPAIDRLATEGVRFDHGYSAAPQCTPARSALFSGMQPWQLEEGASLWGTLPAKFPNYPDILEAANYKVGYTGKPWGPGDVGAGGRSRNPAGPAFNGQVLSPPTSGINSVDYAENFERFLDERQAGQPFCFFYGSFEPHLPWQAGSGLAAGKDPALVDVPDFLPDTPNTRSDLLDYALEIEWFDHQLGRMIAELEERGELENTLIVVSADNGMPFPRAKTTLYDAGTHVPFIIRWGAANGGRIITDYVSLADIAPTILHAAGLDIPRSMSGRSLLPILQSTAAGQIHPNWNRIVNGMERHTRARYDNLGYPIRSLHRDNYLYIRNFRPSRSPAGDPPGFEDIDSSPTKTELLAERPVQNGTDFFQLATGPRPEEELYDLQTDPGCIENLATDIAHADTLASMAAELQTLLEEGSDPRAFGLGDFFDSSPMYRPKRPGLGGFQEVGMVNPTLRQSAEDRLTTTYEGIPILERIYFGRSPDARPGVLWFEAALTGSGAQIRYRRSSGQLVGGVLLASSDLEDFSAPGSEEILLQSGSGWEAYEVDFPNWSESHLFFRFYLEWKGFGVTP